MSSFIYCVSISIVEQPIARMTQHSVCIGLISSMVMFVQSVAHIPNKIQDYDGIAGSTCALMGEKLYQYQTSRLRRRYERSRRKGGKYESEPLFSLPELLSSFGDSSESSSSLESDNEEEAALEERKNKIANISSNLGLSIAEIRQGISSTRRQNSIDTSGTDVNE